MVTSESKYNLLYNPIWEVLNMNYTVLHHHHNFHEHKYKRYYQYDNALYDS